MATPEQRKKICADNGLRDEMEVYGLVSSAAREGVHILLRKGLRANTLKELGYDLAGMKRLGFSESALQDLGYVQAQKAVMPAAARAVSMQDSGQEIANVRDMINAECTYGQFREKGYTVHHLKKAGAIIAQIERLGFSLDDLAQAYSAAELRRAGYGVKDLRRFFSGQQLRTAGFSAVDMRNAGYGIRELVNFGFNENHIKTAGYSTNDLVREGFTKLTVDKSRLH